MRRPSSSVPHGAFVIVGAFSSAGPKRRRSSRLNDTGESSDIDVITKTKRKKKGECNTGRRIFKFR